MSRKLTLSLALATAAMIAAASLASSSAEARGFGSGMGGAGRAHLAFGGGHGLNGGRGNGGRLIPILNPGRGGHGDHPGRGPDRPGHWVFHNHGHWVFRGGRWLILGEPGFVGGAVDAPIAEPASALGPCTCLTRTYTDNGLVVFADMCTKEAASAPVDGTANVTCAPAPDKSSDSSQTAAPSNYAGLTYQDYLAAQKN